jgi:hypothetical protein
MAWLKTRLSQLTKVLSFSSKRCLQIAIHKIVVFPLDSAWVYNLVSDIKLGIWTERVSEESVEENIFTESE